MANLEHLKIPREELKARDLEVEYVHEAANN